jgi:hypothetical protein
MNDWAGESLDNWSERLMASMSPRQRRNFERARTASRIEAQIWAAVPWMRWPILKVVYGFWVGIMSEGIRNTCKPRWGAMTSAWLNDGIKPTVWHTWRSITHDQTDPYTGTYPSGAPSSLEEARAWETKG